ncbi:MAG: hypothetical protein ACYCW6_30565 [Candidatus Xenobia bacterium]
MVIIEPTPTPPPEALGPTPVAVPTATPTPTRIPLAPFGAILDPTLWTVVRGVGSPLLIATRDRKPLSGISFAVSNMVPNGALRIGQGNVSVLVRRTAAGRLDPTDAGYGITLYVYRNLGWMPLTEEARTLEDPLHLSVSFPDPMHVIIGVGEPYIVEIGRPHPPSDRLAITIEQAPAHGSIGLMDVRPYQPGRYH